MKKEQFEIIEAYQNLNEELLLQRIELKVRERHTEQMIEQLQADINISKGVKLKYITPALDMLIERNGFLKRSLVALENNQLFFKKRFSKILKSI